MSFIAGCFSTKKVWLEQDIKSVLSGFEIIPGESNEAYEELVYRYRYGYVMVKHKPDSLARVAVTDREGYTELFLGYRLEGDVSGLTPVERLEACEGEYAAILVDKVEGAVHVVNDRFASRPFYIYTGPDEVIFSSNLMFLFRLMERKPKLDPHGLIQMFVFGNTLGERLHVTDTIRMLPGCRYVVGRNGVQKHVYWEYRYDPMLPESDPKAFAGELFEAFKLGLEKRLAIYPKGVLALSGGLDSRLVAGVMPSDNGYTAFTFRDRMDETESLEVSAARQVGELMGLKHTVQSIQSNNVSHYGRVLTNLIGGLISVGQASKTMTFIEEMCRLERCLVGGGPSNGPVGEYVRSPLHLDRLSIDYYLYHYAVNSFSFAKKVLRPLFKKDAFGVYSEVFRDFVRLLHEQDGPTAAHKITSYNTLSRIGYTFTSPIHTHPDITEFSPHLDYGYVDLLLKMPAAWLYHKTMYKYMIYESLPGLREVPYANTGRCLDGRIEAVGPTMLKSIKYRLDNTVLQPIKVRQTKRRLERGSKAFTYEMLQADTKLLDYMEEVLWVNDTLNTVFERRGCLAFMKGVREGRRMSCSYKMDTEMVGILASLCYLVELAKM